jgi:hypothetical protein
VITVLYRQYYTDCIIKTVLYILYYIYCIIRLHYKTADIHGTVCELPGSELENFGKEDRTLYIDLGVSDVAQAVRLLGTSACWSLWQSVLRLDKSCGSNL